MKMNLFHKQLMTNEGIDIMLLKVIASLKVHSRIQILTFYLP